MKKTKEYFYIFQQRNVWHIFETQFAFFLSLHTRWMIKPATPVYTAVFVYYERLFSNKFCDFAITNDLLQWNRFWTITRVKMFHIYSYFQYEAIRIPTCHRHEIVYCTKKILVHSCVLHNCLIIKLQTLVYVVFR